LSDETIVDAAVRALGRPVERAQRVGGGDINEAWALELGDGSRAFLKSRGDAPADEYAAEAAGLRWLGDAGGLPVPEVLAVLDDPGARGLVLAWIEPGRLGGSGEDLGRGLARVHQAGADAFDALPPGSPRRALRFGGVELPVGTVPAGSPWSAHYAARLELLSGVALDRRRIDGGCAAAVGRVIERIDDLAGPAEPPARVHGDLWSGNVHAGADGRPWLIDPAAHGAHRELDLAMLKLFGSVSPRTYAAYEELEPLADGHEARIGLWQLQPLLVHAILFGGSYGAAVARTARFYA
jgi:fructosamine-3-kinase